jgi:hypothetical protein
VHSQVAALAEHDLVAGVALAAPTHGTHSVQILVSLQLGQQATSSTPLGCLGAAQPQLPLSSMS